MARAQVDRPGVCAVYTRQSVRTESDLTSCQVQRELCADFAAGKGFRVVEEQFDDEGYSGASLDRPALQELLNQVRRGQIHAVAVQRLDRLSRRVSQCAGILDEFRRAGVEVLIAEIPESANGASGRLLTNLLSSFAEFERDMTTSRIADTRAGLVARGRRIAGRIPFGYSTDPKSKQLVPVPREAGIVKTMFELVADGVKTSVVEETALLRSWRTRSGRLWTARQILDTLSNPVYIGRFRAPKGSRPGGHPPIIDEALFQRCADAIAVRRTGSAHRRRSHSGINWIVRGLLYCGSCGRLMGSHTVRVRSVISRYYRCRSTAGGRKPCTGVMVNAYAIEAAVLAELGVGSRLSSKEQADVVKERAARILFDATSGKVRIELIKPPDGSARDEAEATGQHAETGRRKSGPRHR